MKIFFRRFFRSIRFFFCLFLFSFVLFCAVKSVPALKNFPQPAKAGDFLDKRYQASVKKWYGQNKESSAIIKKAENIFLTIWKYIVWILYMIFDLIWSFLAVLAAIAGEILHVFKTAERG